MTSDVWNDLLAWWSALPPGLAFLFALPFLVAIVGLVGDWHGRRRARRPDGRPAHIERKPLASRRRAWRAS